ncbi:MAG: molybdopterin molybdotransferase, partial [Loktanella salsilacus]|uniref:molybdopterin molybdenumtransferase MoeA n=1 Tax=Loktanella salsilacus TaxID=195913 RepID=UPI003988B577
MSFDTVIMVDWSGGNDRGATPKKDAIWTCIARAGQAEPPLYHRNRQIAETYLQGTLTAEQTAGRRTLAAFDLCFAYPAGFAEKLTGSDDPLALWDWFAARVTDTPDFNNRFDLAGQINTQFPGTGPFWGNGRPNHDVPHLPRKGRDRTGHGLPEHRATDLAAPGAFSPWQLSGAGAVGGQVIMGLPMLSRLRHHFGAALSVWPFQPPAADIVLAESYFSLLPVSYLTGHAIRDAAQVALYARAFSALTPDQWQTVLDVVPTAEGWVLGLGHQDLLKGAAMPDLTPPPLRNDCFAMPQGAHWTPVDDALAHLRAQLSPITATETIPLAAAAGRILAAPVIATRSHPPHANAAVDGYAFAGPLPDGPRTLPLHPGRAAAGDPFIGTVPDGHALRILTGANIPDGTDTVVLQEDTAANDTHIALHGPLKQRANARKAGEDMTAGSDVLPAQRRLTPADLA